MVYLVIAACNPLDAIGELAMEKVHAATSKQQSAHPEGAFFVAEDFNQQGQPNHLSLLIVHSTHPTWDAISESSQSVAWRSNY